MPGAVPRLANCNRGRRGTSTERQSRWGFPNAVRRLNEALELFLVGMRGWDAAPKMVRTLAGDRRGASILNLVGPLHRSVK